MPYPIVIKKTVEHYETTNVLQFFYVYKASINQINRLYFIIRIILSVQTCRSDST